MDEEVGNRYFGRLSADVTGGVAGRIDEDDDRNMEWMTGLPSCDDLISLTHRLVSPELASAFSIMPPGIQTMDDVEREAQKTISNLTRCQNKLSSSPPTASLKPFSPDDDHSEETMTLQGEDRKESSILEKNEGDGSSGMMLMEALEGDSSSIHAENSMEDNSGRMLKRTRLVWTPQLHKRFVDVVSYLGIKNAVPKTIMQLMNVDGLTRENVASHLQKYRLYLKRVQGLSNEGPSSSDLLFASTPVPRSLQEQQMPVPMPYTVPAMIPLSFYSLPHQLAHGMIPVNKHQGASLYNRFDSHHLDVPKECSDGNKFAPIFSYPHHVSPSGK